MSSNKKIDKQGLFIAAGILLLGLVLAFGLTKAAGNLRVSGNIPINSIRPGSGPAVIWKNPAPVQTTPASTTPVQTAPASTANAVTLSGRIPILMYHYIGDVPSNADRVRQDLTVSPSDFSAQMDYLKKQGYETITTADLYNAVNGKKSLPSKPVIVTFDDGYVDTFKNAVPILKERGMIGVFAIITEYPGFPAYASWDSIIAAKDSGMEIIPHTRHHIDFHDPKYTEAQRVDEVQGSIQDIKNKLGVNSISFVYPYGHFDPDEEKILKSNGIALAFTTAYGWFQKGVNQLEVPRVRVHGSETIQRFADLLLGNKIN